MEDIKTYKCKECGKETEYKSNEPEKPECCGKPMENLDFCTKTDTAEHARGSDDDEACNDGRAG